MQCACSHVTLCPILWGLIAIGSFGVTRKNGNTDCYYISHFLRLITSVYDFSAFTHMYYRKGSSLVLLNETCLTVIIAFQFRFFSPQYESEEQLLLELARKEPTNQEPDNHTAAPFMAPGGLRPHASLATTSEI